MNYSLKKTIEKLHLWLGLASGVVVLIVSITGAIYTFEEEINIQLQSGVYQSVEQQNKAYLTPFEIEESIKSQISDSVIYMNMTIFPKSDRANVVWKKINIKNM